MKVLTLAGTRPELIRLCLIINKLDSLVDHVFVYTNQNYDYNLSTVFFDGLSIRKPDYYFDFVTSSVGEFLSESFLEFSSVLDKEKPDKILVLGDTNSGLLAMLAAKRGIPVYHMEAGNRCFDDRVPEETNRKIIDSFSKYNLPYTENSKQNLLNEGYHKNYVLKIGNPINEVLQYFASYIESSDILNKLGIEEQKFILVTAHRAENIDDSTSLNEIVKTLNYISEKVQVVFPMHPRTKNKIEESKMEFSPNVLVIDPVGLFDFVKLEQKAKLVISDSGTVQEEACIFKVPSLTIRKFTERQETIECGSNILTGINFKDVTTAFDTAISMNNPWPIPKDYLITNVSDTVIHILVGRAQ